MGKPLKAKADMADRKNVSLAPSIIKIGKRLASERGQSFSGFLAELIRRENSGGGSPAADFATAGVSARLSEFNHELGKFRTRIKQGEDYANSLFDHLRRTDAAMGKLDHRVRALEEARKVSDPLIQDGGIH